MGVSLAVGDINNLNKANSNQLNGVNYGYQMGGGRAVFSATGGSTVAAHGTGLIVPKGCFVTRALYWVSTTFTSANSTATIALSIATANDVVSAAAINAGGTPWTTTTVPVVTVPILATLSTNFHVTADSELTATVAVEALTAGKMVIWVEWIYHGDLSAT